MRELFPRCRSSVDVVEAYDDPARRQRGGRPHVLVNMVASVDGATAVSGRAGPLANASDTHVFHLLRALADVILVGAETVRVEGYGPARVREEFAELRAAYGLDSEPAVAVITASLDLDPTSRLFTEATTRPVVIAPADSPADRLDRLRPVADLVLAGDGRVDLAEALRQLGERGASVVLCEGGPKLNGQLADLDLVDELCLSVSPALAGATSAPLMGMTPLAAVHPLELAHVLEDEGFLFLRYRVQTPPAADALAIKEPAEERRLAEVEPEVASEIQTLAGGLDGPMFIVTTASNGRRGGCLIGFAVQCSVRPPRFMAWLSKTNATFRVAETADLLAVHALSSDDHALAEHFGSQSGDDVDKFAQVNWTEGPDGVPLLTDVHRRFVGRILDRFDGGDHVGFLLDPVEAVSGKWPGQLGFQSVRDIEAGHDV